ncbi:hypothetical protein Tco_1579482, partial [Tanacetum coccineum]
MPRWWRRGWWLGEEGVGRSRGGCDGVEMVVRCGGYGVEIGGCSVAAMGSLGGVGGRGVTMVVGSGEDDDGVVEEMRGDGGCDMVGLVVMVCEDGGGGRKFAGGGGRRRKMRGEED